MLKERRVADDHSLMFDLGLKSRQLLGPALAVGVLAVSAVISQSPEKSEEINVVSETPGVLAFDDSLTTDSTGQAVPPDAVAASQSTPVRATESAGTAAEQTGTEVPSAPAGATSNSASGPPGLRPTPLPQSGSSPSPGSSAGASDPQLPAPSAAPSNSGQTSASTNPVTTARPAAAPTTVRSSSAPNPAPTTAPTARPTTAAPSTTPPTTAVPTTAVPTTAAPTRAAPTTAAPTSAAPPAAGNQKVIGVLLEGESTSDPNGGWNQYPNSVRSQLGTGVTVHVDGTNGYRIDDVNNEGGKSQLLTGGTGSNVAVLWIGINDTSQGKEPTTAYAEMTTWIQNRRAEGWDHVVLLTVTKFEHDESVKSYSWGSHAVADQKRQELNQLIVANSAGADRIVDLRDVTGIGDGYSVYDTNYRADKVHFTDTGNELVADAVVGALRSLQP